MMGLGDVEGSYVVPCKWWAADFLIGNPRDLIQKYKMAELFLVHGLFFYQLRSIHLVFHLRLF